MQSYFNPDDARLEVHNIISGHSSKSFFTEGFPYNGRTESFKFLVLVSLLFVFILIMKYNLSSTEPVFILSPPKQQVDHSFTVEIPKPKIKKIEKPIVKIQKPKSRKPIAPKRRSAEAYAATYNPQIKESRDLKQEQNREQLTETAVARAIPSIESPVIELDAKADRAQASDQIRQVSEVIVSDTVREYAHAEPGERHAPDIEFSHTELDPYYYQMVDICLRLCAQSIFLRQNVGDGDQRFSSNWLKVDTGDNNNSMLIKHQGRWVKFIINTSRLQVLSDLSFIEIPGEYSDSFNDLQYLFEDVTRKLCKHLSHTDCLENL